MLGLEGPLRLEVQLINKCKWIESESGSANEFRRCRRRPAAARGPAAGGLGTRNIIAHVTIHFLGLRQLR